MFEWPGKHRSGRSVTVEINGNQKVSGGDLLPQEKEVNKKGR